VYVRRRPRVRAVFSNHSIAELAPHESGRHDPCAVFEMNRGAVTVDPGARLKEGMV